MTDTLALKPMCATRWRRLVLLSLTSKLTGILLILLTDMAASACKSRSKTDGVDKSARTALTGVTAPAANVGSAAPTRSYVTPAGPPFAIIPGVGLGPVRFGATVATIERLMEAKCDELTDKICRYIPAGIEYELTDGVVSGIIVYRHDRSVPGNPGKVWGRTRCAIPPDLTPRVILSYVHSNLGQPQSVEKVATANPNRIALRETYPGLVIEYDRGEYTNELIVGSIRIVKAETAPAPRALASHSRATDPLH